MVDEYGFHLLSCHFSEGRLPRHAAINDIICRALKSAGSPSILESVGLNRANGTRPDSITIYPFSQGIALSWDATCVNTYAESSVNDTASTAGKAAANAEDLKKTKYSEMANRYRFKPIAIETAGVIGPSARVIVEKHGSYYND